MKRSRISKRARKRPATHRPRGDYPSLDERKRIIERRDSLLRELIKILVVPQTDDRGIRKLVQRYGPQEVHLVLDTFQKRASSAEMIGDEASVYREYRRAFARFGGDRLLLSAQEHSDLSFQYGKLNAERTIKSIIPRKPEARERELADLLLSGADYWEDITPPAVPPRPPNFEAPSPGRYDYPVRQLLKWGWNLDEKRAKNNSGNVSKWRPATGELVRMALDVGLLNGWPGEPASWAPYHALNMLGYLRAHEVAGQLFALFEQEDDWLSDRLAVVWEQMGPQAEPTLWDYVDNSERNPNWRSVAMLGLANIAETNAARRSSIVSRLAHLLRSASVDDAEANAYIVHALDRLKAAETAEVIVEAFEQGKVDEKIVDLASVSVLDWGDPDLYDRFYGQR